MLHSKADSLWLLILKLVFLQIQRNLQIRIEEQGKHLQMMFEQQRKMEEEKNKATSANSDRPQSSNIDDTTAKELTTNDRISEEENPCNKEMPSEEKVPPTKRAKTSEMGEVSRISWITTSSLVNDKWVDINWDSCPLIQTWIICRFSFKKQHFVLTFIYSRIVLDIN